MFSPGAQIWVFWGANSDSACKTSSRTVSAKSVALKYASVVSNTCVFNKLVKSVLESYGFPVKADWGKNYGEV